MQFLSSSSSNINRLSHLTLSSLLRVKSKHFNISLIIIGNKEISPSVTCHIFKSNRSNGSILVSYFIIFILPIIFVFKQMGYEITISSYQHISFLSSHPFIFSVGPNWIDKSWSHVGNTPLNWKVTCNCMSCVSGDIHYITLWHLIDINCRVFRGHLMIIYYKLKFTVTIHILYLDCICIS